MSTGTHGKACGMISSPLISSPLMEPLCSVLQSSFCSIRASEGGIGSSVLEKEGGKVLQVPPSPLPHPSCCSPLPRCLLAHPKWVPPCLEQEEPLFLKKAVQRIQMAWKRVRTRLLCPAQVPTAVPWNKAKVIPVAPGSPLLLTAPLEGEGGCHSPVGTRP